MPASTSSSFLLAYMLDATVFILILCLACFYPSPPTASSTKSPGVLWPFFTLRKTASSLCHAPSSPFSLHLRWIMKGFKHGLAALFIRALFRRVSSFFGSASPGEPVASPPAGQNRPEIHKTGQAITTSFGLTPSYETPFTSTILLLFFAGIVITLLYLIIDERRRFGEFLKWRDAASLNVGRQDLNHSARNQADSVAADATDSGKTLEAIKVALKCPICTELLTQPYTLDPCGHTFDLVCLQQWFRTAPDEDEEEETLPTMAYSPVNHDKICPICRAVVYLPSPCYSLKSVISALKPGGTGGPLANETDPWLDIFFEDLDL